MANSTVNKVILGTETLLDLTEDTATEADVASGKVFHLASGAQATGTATVPTAMTEAEILAAVQAGWVTINNADTTSY